MHPALQNARIVSIILRSFNFNFSCPKDRRACITVGLACQIFLPSALNELWRELLDLESLIKTIDGIKTIELSGPLGDERPRRQYYLDRLLLQDEIGRLKYYAQRVEVFYHQDNTATELFASIDPSLMFQIVSLLPVDEPLFTSLRKLHLGGPSPSIDIAVAFSPHVSKLFLSTSLKSVTFRLSGSDTMFGADIHSPNIWLFLRGISRMSPQMLQDLDLGFVLHPRYLKPCFEHFTCLEFLKLPTGCHSLETLQHISGLPNLLSLLVTLGCWKWNLEELPGRKIPFKRLMILVLDSNVESARAVFSHFRFPELDKLEVSHLDRDMVDEGCWKDLVGHIVDDLPNLRSLVFDYRSREPSANGLRPHQAFPWRCFDHLLQLALIEELSIRAPRVDSLSNDTFSSMADAWPDLARLRIDTAKLGDIDFRTLIMVESRLRHLRSLVLSIDMPGAWVPIPPTSPHILQHLQIPSLKDEEDDMMLSQLSIEEQSEIAAFLDTLFPTLDVNSFYGTGDKGRSGLGRSMDKLVGHLQNAGKRRAAMVLRNINVNSSSLCCTKSGVYSTI